jgi:hypothetical protein
MEQNFKIESRHADQIEIRHVAEGHLYVFHVGAQPDGRRVLSPAYQVRSAPGADHDGMHFIFEAFELAETEFRLAGEID